ncbi:MAG: hypothetical protein C0603_00530 [Denitrovibrio sp.]|nr:MAG: hypothetical protein C0603_00530 [Denitrovibrio sp.]
MPIDSRIVIIRSGALGDLLQLVPFMRAHKSIFPKKHITLACGISSLEAIKHSPYIDDIITFNDNIIYNGSYLSKISETIKLIFKLRKFDKCYVMHIDKRWQILPVFAGVQDIIKLTLIKNCSLIDGMLECLPSATKHNKRYEFHPNKIKITIPEQPYIALATGGGRNSQNDSACKRWTGYTKLINEIIDKTDFNIVLLGLDEDNIDIKHKRITNLCGMTTLSDAYHLIDAAELFVGNDSGLLHLACCTKTKKVGIFTSTDPNRILGNIADVIPITSTLPCSPCEKNGKFRSDCNNECVDSISVKSVLEFIKK